MPGAHRARLGGGDAVDGGDGHPPRAGRVQRWRHLPQGGWAARCDEGAKRCVAVDVMGLPLAAAVVPASTHENDTTRLLLGLATRARPGRPAGTGEGGPRRDGEGGHVVGERVRCHGGAGVGHGGPRGTFVPLAYAWRVEVAHGHLLRSRQSGALVREHDPLSIGVVAGGCCRRSLGGVDVVAATTRVPCVLGLVQAVAWLPGSGHQTGAR
jgi:hypothetical protein